MVKSSLSSCEHRVYALLIAVKASTRLWGNSVLQNTVCVRPFVNQKPYFLGAGKLNYYTCVTKHSHNQCSRGTVYKNKTTKIPTNRSVDGMTFNPFDGVLYSSQRK